MKTISIRLTSPLQSYGNEAQFARRTTGDYPSKSAIVGMLAAALCYQRDDPAINALNDLLFAVRVDQPGQVMTEFQTAEWKPGTRKLTYRDLLQDAVFVVAIGSEDEAWLDRLAEALRHPRFQLYLGRRANVPAGVLKIQTFAGQDPVGVLAQLPWQASRWYQRRSRRQASMSVQLIADAVLLPERRADLVRDAVHSFDQKHRQYSFRPIAVTKVQLANPEYKPAPTATAQDAFGQV